MTLLAVAVAGRGVVDPGEPVFHADDEAVVRGTAAFLQSDRRCVGRGADACEAAGHDHPAGARAHGESAQRHRAGMKPAVRVIGVEPAGADDAARSFKAGQIIPSVNPRTIADGLRSSLGEKPFAEIRRYVDDIVTVSDDAIVKAMRLIWEVMKIIVEPSGAVPYAAIIEERLAVRRRKVALVLTGGNLDLDRLPFSGG